MSSLVMAAWRERLYSNVSFSSISAALLVEDSIAATREAFSLDAFSAIALYSVYKCGRMSAGIKLVQEATLQSK